MTEAKDSSQSYSEFKEQIKEEQSNKSADQILKDMKRSYEYAVALDDLPTQKHNWTDRGLKLTCEYAGHPYHESWKVRKAVL